jgi:hypothetical protein
VQGEFTNPKRAYIYFVVILNVSQFWALYCLVMFYHTLTKDLMALKPLKKFLVVKAVVFFSFWQQILIAVRLCSQYASLAVFVRRRRETYIE